MLKQLRTGLVGQGGPLSGWGFSSGDDGAGVGGIAGEVVYLGAFGQLTVDGTCLLFEDSTNKRVGVNTCVPQYPLDINSNECDSKIVAIRNGNADADVDMFANYDAAPGARVRLSRTDDGIVDPTFQLRFYINEDIAGVNTLHERLSLSKVVDVKAGFALSGHISPPQITADQNNYNPTDLASAAVLHLTSNASRNITGLAQGFDGNIKVIHNSGSQNIVLVNESASSLAENRFKFGSSITVPVGTTIMLFYDGHISRWVSVGGSTGMGSGVANRMAYWVTPTVLGALESLGNAGNVAFADANGLPIGNTSNHFFWDNINKRLRISSNVTPAPEAALEIQGGPEGSPGSSTIKVVSLNDVIGVRLDGYNWRFDSIAANVPIFSIRGGGNNVASETGKSIQSQIVLRAAETWSASARGTYITFETTPIGSLTMAEVIRFGPSGQLGIGGANFGASGNLVRSNGSGSAVSWQDHTLDFLTQYLLLAGRAGGQIQIGGTAAADDLTLRATAGVGAGSEAIILQVGNNGALEALRAGQANSQSVVAIGTDVLDINNASTLDPRFIVAGAGVAHNVQIIRHTTPGSGGAVLSLSATRGAGPNTHSALLANDGLGTFQFEGSDGTRFLVGAQIQAVVETTFTTDTPVAYLSLKSNPGSSVNTPPEGARLTANGNFLTGRGASNVFLAALATTATNGFFYIPSCAGTPTGTPTAYTGKIPLVYDSTNNILYAYSNGAWRTH